MHNCSGCHRHAQLQGVVDIQAAIFNYACVLASGVTVSLIAVVRNLAQPVATLATTGCQNYQDCPGLLRPHVYEVMQWFIHFRDPTCTTPPRAFLATEPATSSKTATRIAHQPNKHTICFLASWQTRRQSRFTASRMLPST